VKKTIDGSCHCGKVRFRVRTSAEEIYDCNCSICTMKGFLHLIVERSEFDLLAGQDDITTYTFNTGVAKHTFCRTCGVHPFYTPRSHPNGVDVNARCLDLDGEAPDVVFRIVPFDGQHWEASAAAIQ
jgi:hypothetical protein